MIKPQIESRCSKTVFPGRFPPHQCTRDWTVERDGKHYCWQHDPERIARLAAERRRKWDRKWAEDKERYHRRRLEHQACSEVPTEVLERGLSMAKLLTAVEAAFAYLESVIEYQNLMGKAIAEDTYKVHVLLEEALGRAEFMEMEPEE